MKAAPINQGLPGAALTQFVLGSETATFELAEMIAPALQPGDRILLSGPLGAGKTALARVLIQTLQAEFGPIEEIPSPSFTLVQTYYAGAMEIWHADLYRIGDPSELAELGLDPLPNDVLALIEWPERNPGGWDKGAVTFRLDYVDQIDDPDVREFQLLAAPDEPLAKRLLGVLPS